MRFLLSLLLVLWPQIPQGGITGGASVTPVAFKSTWAITTQAGASYSTSATVTAGGTNKCAFAIVGFAGTGGAITSVTYGGNAMTSVGTAAANTSATFHLQAFYLVNPPTGSNTLASTGNGSVTSIYMNIVSFTICNQTTPVRPGTYQTSNGNSTSASQSITSSTTDLTVAIVGSASGVTSTNQTSDGLTNAGAIGCASDHATTAAATITDTWVVSSGQWALLGFSVQP